MLFSKLHNFRLGYKGIAVICFYIENQHNFIISKILILEVIAKVVFTLERNKFIMSYYRNGVKRNGELTSSV
jgi:hypothetical protein